MGPQDSVLRTEREGIAPELESRLEAQSPRDDMRDWNLLT